MRTRLFQGAAMAPLMAPEDESGGAAPAAQDTTPAGGADSEPAAGGEDSQEGGGADSLAGGDGDGDPAPPPPKPRVPWQNKRIDALTATAREAQEAREAAERRAADAEARAASYEALYGRPEGAPAAPAAPAAADPPGERRYTQSELQAEAARIAAANVLNQRCENLFDEGAKAHGKTWTERVNAAAQAFGADLQKRPDVFEAITALPNGPDVYHELAGDLDHMAEVLSMGPVQLGMELARISARVGAKSKGPKVSSAPAPIDPIDGNGGGETPLDKLPMEDYVKQREQQRAARYAARQ